MSSPPWDSIPLLALKCILNHLDEKSALSAMATCQHWRSAVLMYEGHRDVLKLHMGQYEKNTFLMSLFRRHTRRLQIYIPQDENESIITACLCYILPRFFDSPKLVEVDIVGPIYLTNRKSTYIQLIRLIQESLVFKHAHKLERLGLFGCDMNYLDYVKPVTKKVEEGLYYMRPQYEAYHPLTPGPNENSILSRNNANLMNCSALTHIAIEYELLSTDGLVTLSKLDNFKLLSLNIVNRQGLSLPQIEWTEVTPLFSKGLEVSVCLIAISSKVFPYVIDNALCVGMPLISLKVMYCRTVDMELICHVTDLYSSSLREVTWADKPASDQSHRVCRLNWARGHGRPFSNVNPFIFLAWQCQQLRKLAIHGYWMSEYDLLGIIRLRKGILLDVSSIYDSTDDTTTMYKLSAPSRDLSNCILRVLSSDADKLHVKSHDVNRKIESEGILCPSSPQTRLGMSKLATLEAKAELIVQEVMGVT